MQQKHFEMWEKVFPLDEDDTGLCKQPGDGKQTQENNYYTFWKFIEIPKAYHGLFSNINTITTHMATVNTCDIVTQSSKAWSHF
jgi:hypothetical protein